MRRARHKNQKKNIQKKIKRSEFEVSGFPLFSEEQMIVLRAWEKKHE